MSTYHLSELSLSRLQNVHPDLVQVVYRAIQLTSVDFMVVEGRRTLARQRRLVSQGKSTTMNSRHLTGHAVDLCAWVNGRLEWGKPHSSDVADAVKRAAAELNVEIDWGGDWRSFKDTPHFQLDWGAYPKQDTSWHSGEQAATMVPAPRHKRQTMKMLRKNSRKYRAADTMKWLKGFFGLGSAGGATGLLISSKTQLDAVGALVGAYGWIALFAVAAVFIALMLGSHYLQDLMGDDVESGRSVPSGMSGGAGPGGWL